MKFALTLSLVLAASATLYALQESSSGTWEVPDEAKAVENPVENTPEALSAGAELFKKHCVMCHGESGKGDGPATQFIKPAPPDVTTADARNRLTDGEIFYKMTVGKQPMPPMNRKMSETERWQVVHYLRSLQAN
ncbi:MAG TPA: cytochrome c [Vicinamibacteria bacterium]|nr:cytochrome c [Vicinamibacteria bacterium]